MFFTVLVEDNTRSKFKYFLILILLCVGMVKLGLCWYMWIDFVLDNLVYVYMWIDFVLDNLVYVYIGLIFVCMIFIYDFSGFV